MFVRFREYNLANGHKSLRCEVVENNRDKCSGKVRQRSISYLGSIKKQFLKYSRVRDEFWRQVERKLSGLPLSDIEAQKIRLAINERVPRAAKPIYQKCLGHKEVKVNSHTPVLHQTPSSSADEAPEQSAKDLLSNLAAKLGLNL